MKTALLIIDIQNDYFPGGANELVGPEKAAENAASLLKHFRRAGMPVVHVQHLSTRPGSAFFIPGTPGVEINASVLPSEGEKVVIKHFPNSFRDTGLEEYLRGEGVTNLVICGMMTQMCVDSTVRAAKDLGYEITVISDGCATKDLKMGEKIVSASEVQASFLAAMTYFYAEVTTAAEYFYD